MKAVGIVAIFLMTDDPLAYAQTGALVSKHPQTDYQLGYKLRVRDSSCQPDCNLYILQPGQGFINQTDSFIEGYLTGYCKIAGP
jgi:hypothetical protein